MMNKFQFVAILIWMSHVKVISLPPNIIFIIADDLGWNDVSWHNDDILTPNLQALVDEGVTLERYYVQPSCTPSRSAFLTGRYPYHVGTQHGVFHPLENISIPLSFTLLPELLKEVADYETHLVGKWHLGYCNWKMTPTHRGFDSFYGFYNGAIDYYTHEQICYWNHREPKDCRGLDFRDNERIVTDETYTTELFRKRAIDIIQNHPNDRPLFLELSFQAVHAPLQVPERYLKGYEKVADDSRKVYSGMVTALDEAVGKVVETLKVTGLYSNSIIVFTTDNGAHISHGGSNWPLRGMKGTLWEGGTKGVAFVHSPLIGTVKRVNTDLMHAVDWLPTFLEIAGIRGAPSDLDGISQWKTIKDRKGSERKEFVYNIYFDEDGDLANAGLRYDRYKLLLGDPGHNDGWYHPKNRTYLKTDGGDASKCNVYLFDLEEDPLEKDNMAETYPDIVGFMLRRIAFHAETHVPLLKGKELIKGEPRYWNNVYSPGWC
ncbi:Uncharacterised protein g4037 [Pycnogonum litorale]